MYTRVHVSQVYMQCLCAYLKYTLQRLCTFPKPRQFDVCYRQMIHFQGMYTQVLSTV